MYAKLARKRSITQRRHLGSAGEVVAVSADNALGELRRVDAEYTVQQLVPDACHRLQ